MKKIKNNSASYIELPLDHIKTRFDWKTAEMLFRSVMSNEGKEKRDKKSHMVDVAQLVER